MKNIICLFCMMMGFNSYAQITMKDFLNLDAKALAQRHNEELLKMREYQNRNPNATPRDILSGIKTDLTSKDRDIVYNNASRNNDATANFNYVTGLLKTAAAKNIYTNINNAILSTTSYTSLVSAVDRELNTAAGTLTGFDLKVIQIFGETAKASGSYWYSQTGLSGKPPKWVTQDGNGIAQASVGWAVTAAIFGGGPASYFVACGVGGALASIWP